MPRWEMRSFRAPRISASRSGVMARLLGLRVKVLGAGLGTGSGGVPERLVPNLMRAVSPQWGQARRIMPSSSEQRHQIHSQSAETYKIYPWGIS